MDHILYSVEKSVATITLHRADKFNSFIRQMALDMQRSLDDAANDPNVRCILITGEGKAFSAGQDLAEATDPNGPELTTILNEH